MPIMIIILIIQYDLKPLVYFCTYKELARVTALSCRLGRVPYDHAFGTLMSGCTPYDRTFGALIAHSLSVTKQL